MDIHKEYMEKHRLKESDFDNIPEIWNALNSVQKIIDKHEGKAENLPIADVRLCPECKEPYTEYTQDEYYICNSCDHSWIGKG